MTKQFSETKWQDIGWNGLFFQLPAAWQPTVIYPAYLCFELAGQPVLEIKFQQINGHFSAKKNFNRIRSTLKEGSRLESWEISPELQHHLSPYTASGFQLHRNNNTSRGLMLFCSKCMRATLLQWYIGTAEKEIQIEQIVGSFRDHSEQPEQLWSLFDIKALIPAGAQLQSHEFLPGGYTICFDLEGTSITLYRFKPAKVLLKNKKIRDFGRTLLNMEPRKEGDNWAFWFHHAEGLELLLAKTRRKPVWNWMRLWHIPEHNVILGVKAAGKRREEHNRLERICEQYSSKQSY